MQRTRRFLHGSRRRTSLITRSIRKTGRSFGYMFARLHRKKSVVLEDNERNRTLLADLGRTMQDTSTTANENPKITAGYTYLGQFIDHDISFDATSDIAAEQDALKTQNFRSMSLDLDSIYGRGPVFDIFLYDFSDGIGNKFLLGANQPLGEDNDVPRNTQIHAPANDKRRMQATALIGDPRNDENLIVSQIHVAFLKFHNAVVDQLLADGTATKDTVFNEARILVKRHYQWIVLHDFLETIAGKAMVDTVLGEGVKYFDQRRLFMPVEFSGAAYRFGHSVIRANYNYNAQFPAATLKQLFEFVRPPLAPVPSSWIIDWKRFFKLEEGNEENLNFARKIDTKVAPPLFNLPDEAAGILQVLSIRNLHRGLSFGLPTGQAIAKKMNVNALTRGQLLSNVDSNQRKVLERHDKLLLKKTPLWYYILKEAEVLKKGLQLGPIGGRIVVEVFVRMLLEDEESILRNENWRPSLKSKRAGRFTMVDLLKFAGVA